MPASCPGEDRRGYTRPRWTCTSSGRWLPLPSARPWTPSSGRPNRAGVGGARRPGIEGHAARGGHEARAGAIAAAAGAPRRPGRIGWISQPALNYISRRLRSRRPRRTASRRSTRCIATKPRPPVVAHVCDDIACRIAGAERICDDLERRSGRRARRRATAGSAGCDRRASGCATSRPAAMVTIAGDDPRPGSRRPSTRWDRAPAERPARLRTAHASGRPRTPPPCPPGRRSPTSAASTHRRRRPDLARRLPRHGGYTALARGPRDRPRGGHRRGHRVQAHGPRRRRVPDRPQVGRGRRASPPSRTTSSATPTSRSPARSRTGCSWRATRSRSSSR